MSTTTGGWPENSHAWTPEQHRLMACSILDGQHVAGLVEAAGDLGEPEWRHYTALSDSDDQHPDLGPFLAALAHAVLAAVPAVDCRRHKAAS